MKPTPQFHSADGFESFYRQGPDPYGYLDKDKALRNWRVRVSAATELLRFARERSIGRWPVGSLLDFGCGEGITLKGMLGAARIKPRLIAGCDASATAIERCAAAPWPDAGETDFRAVSLGWGDMLPWSDRSFDLVLVFGVLYALKEPQQLGTALGEIIRVTAEGGLLLLMHIETSCPASADGYRSSLGGMEVEPVIEHRFHAGDAGLTRAVVYRRGGVV